MLETKLRAESIDEVIDDHMIYETKSALMIILFCIQSDFVFYFALHIAYTAQDLLTQSVHTLWTNNNSSKHPNRSKLTVLLCWLLNKYSIWFAVVYYLLHIMQALGIQHRISNAAFQCLFDVSVWQHEKKKMTENVSSISVNRRLLNW